MIKELQNINQGSFNEIIRGLQKEVEGYLEDDDLKWRQREKMKWLRDGDKNTRYFHSCANQMKQFNTIHYVLSSEGTWAKSQEEISNQFQQFYHDLFTSSQPMGISESLNTLWDQSMMIWIDSQLKLFLLRRLQLQSWWWILWVHQGLMDFLQPSIKDHWKIIGSDLVQVVCLS